MTETCAEAHDLANVVTFPGENPRKTTFTFACGCSVTVAAPDDHMIAPRDPTLVWIGRRLRWARQHVYASPAEFARVIGTTTAKLREIEEGDRALTLSQLISAANKLRCGSDYLLMGELRLVDPALRGLLVKRHPELRQDELLAGKAQGSA